MISCLCLTYNRPSSSNGVILLQEAVNSFLAQDHEDCELLIVNDTPGQELTVEGTDSRIRVFNLDSRFRTLSDKIQFAINNARGEFLCRWDDDDIHLPWALSYMLDAIGYGLEWHASNYWYSPTPGRLEEVNGAANTHIQALWRREVLDRIGGYPAGLSGNEDQAFNRAVMEKLLGVEERLPPHDLYYIYRWGVSPSHLSGVSDGGEHPHQRHYDELGRRPVNKGLYTIRPMWQRPYVEYAKQAAQ